ncbi:MAG: WbqC family protein, partial [Candidatus Omnitrophica bacterium]|nr:WbqC family protein [Candidatus Omnitrophota bacterium]
EKEGIKVIFQDYKHPEYEQSYKPFIGYLSVIDLLFN